MGCRLKESSLGASNTLLTAPACSLLFSQSNDADSHCANEMNRGSSGQPEMKTSLYSLSSTVISGLPGQEQGTPLPSGDTFAGKDSPFLMLAWKQTARFKSHF